MSQQTKKKSTSTTTKSKGVAEKSSVEGSAKQLTPQSTDPDMLREMISSTTSSVMKEILPLLEQSRKDHSKELDAEMLKKRATHRMNKEFDEAVSRNKKFLEKMAKLPQSEYRTIRIPKMYRKYLGSSLPVGINGSIIYIPIDNKPHRIPKEYYALAQRKLEYEDDKNSVMESTDRSDIHEVDSIESLGQ